MHNRFAAVHPLHVWGPQCYTFLVPNEAETALERLRAAEFKVVGAHQTARAVSRGQARVVFVAQDADRRMVEDVLTAARDRGVEVIEVDSRKSLGRACGIAVGTAAAAIVSSQ